MNTLLRQFGGQNQTLGACAQIPGIGLPVLAIKKMLLNIETNLDSGNQQSFSKIIYFNERASPQGLFVTVVLKFYTFSASFYVGVYGLLKAKGLPRFQLLNYHYDTDILAVANTLNVATLDDNNFVTCGEVKTIYTNYVRSMKVDQSKIYNIPAGRTSGPRPIPSSLGQPTTFYQQPQANVGPFNPYY